MFGDRRLPKSQEWYIKPMQEYGYTADSGGVCYGVANKAIDAILLQDIDTFNQRFYLINAITASVNADPTHTKTFTGMLEAVKQKSIPILKEAREEVLKDLETIKKNALLAIKEKESLQALIEEMIRQEVDKKLQENLTAQEYLMLSIPPFFEGVEIYLQADLHPILFEEDERPVTQEAILSASLASSARLDQETMGGRAQVDAFSGVYSPDEVSAYLENLRQILEGDPPFTEPFTLLLSGVGHSIVLGYDADKKKMDIR